MKEHVSKNVFISSVIAQLEVRIFFVSLFVFCLLYNYINVQTLNIFPFTTGVTCEQLT